MSDDKQFYENEIDDLFDDREPLEDDFDLYHHDEKQSAQPNQRWLHIGSISLLLALVPLAILGPVIDLQKQRSVIAASITGLLNLASDSASGALRRDGDFLQYNDSIAELEKRIDGLTNQTGIYARISNVVFDNNRINAQLVTDWFAYKNIADQFAAHENNVNNIIDALNKADTDIIDAQNQAVEFVKAVAKEGRSRSAAEEKNRYLFLTNEAAHINGILGSLVAQIHAIYLQKPDFDQTSNNLNELMVRLKDILDRTISNSAAVVATAAQPLQLSLNSIETSLLTVSDNIDTLKQAQQEIARLAEHAQALNLSSVAASDRSNLDTLQLLSYLLPVFLVSLGIFALWRFFRTSDKGQAQREATLHEAIAAQQESILKLLDEMSALADGDLTIEAEVTDQVTGAIADSVNFAVIEMRELVAKIYSASDEVASGSEQAMQTAEALSQSNIQQAGQINSAAEQMQKVTDSMHEMSSQATISSEVADGSVKLATDGAIAVRDTITGMENMRVQIQDTSKRIKRLGESSQRIGDIVALITDIAEQTNILSLNAAIQASMAGEAGRGFAVVSDEVQGLAERSTEATKRITELVATIQTDTNDAIASMEKATGHVVSGTKVADSAGRALSEIESASEKLSSLVKHIARKSNEQAQIVTGVAEQVDQVSKSSTSTSEEARASAKSIAKLVEFARELEVSVSKFKLPAS